MEMPIANDRQSKIEDRKSRRLGFHVSIAGGLPKAVERALERRCTTLQIFCGNPRGWAMMPRSDAEVESFRKARAAAGLSPLFVHACYLINPCAPNRSVFARSVRRLAEELRAASQLGAEFYIIHPGSQRGKSPAWGVRRAAEAIVQAARQAGDIPEILIENTASQHGPGGSFESLGSLIEEAKAGAPGLRLGVALDSCHAFGAGYDLREPSEVERLAEEADAAVGLSRVKLIHANDSRDEPGSRRDRHYHIGRGTIGPAGMRNLLRHPRLSGLPLILETPCESLDADLRNMQALRRLTGER